MKSRTSFFNSTAFRKNLTRFAPAWALYEVLLLLILITMVGSGSNDWFDAHLIDTLALFPVANFLFAFLSAQLLYGDLYNSRMCNALHALPLRRESWFVTNLASGLSFQLIPTLAALIFSTVLIALGFGRCDNGLIAPLMVFLGANLQYLFFFGLATLSAFLVGSRFAMAVVYGILNFASLIVFWLVDTLYTPMLYGVETAIEPFMLFSPVVQMCSASYMDVQWLETERSAVYNDRGVIYFTEGWGYAGVCAAVGIAMLALALQLYRKRKLECAGDFMAVKGMEPVFLTVYTLFVGALFQLIFSIFNGNDIDIFLFVGIFVGFFTGRMLLKRTVRVFQGKAWLQCAALTGAFLLTLLITSLDPLGIARWVPKAEDVKSVTVYGNGGYVSLGECFTVEDTEDVENIIRVHELVLADAMTPDEMIVEPTVIVAGETKPAEYYSISVTLEYRLKDGGTISRYYHAQTNSEAGRILKDYFGSVECILGVPKEELPALAAELREVYVDGELVSLDKLGLLEAMAADCEEGNLMQIWAYRKESAQYDTVFYVELVTTGQWNNIRVNEACTHTLAWLEENGIELPNYDEKFG